MPFSRRIVDLTLCTILATQLAACSSNPPAARNAPLPSDAHGFRVELMDSSVTSRKSFPAALTSNLRIGNSVSFSIRIALSDVEEARIFRINKSSRLTSIVDDRGRELLPSGNQPLAYYNSQNAEFFIPAGRTDDRPMTPKREFNQSFPIAYFPLTVSRIVGTIDLDVATEELDITIPLPEVQAAIDLPSGMKTTLHTFQVDENTKLPKQVALELETPLNPPAASSAAPGDPGKFVVFSVELLDASGLSLVPLRVREDYAVGQTHRRRFVIDPSSPFPRHPNQPSRTAASLRFRILTVSPVEIPFQFGPIDYRDSDPPSFH